MGLVKGLRKGLLQRSAAKACWENLLQKPAEGLR
jgi:hypothetical protein